MNNIKHTITKWLGIDRLIGEIHRVLYSEISKNNTAKNREIKNLKKDVEDLIISRESLKEEWLLINREMEELKNQLKVMLAIAGRI